MENNAMPDRTVTASFNKPEAAQSAIAALRNQGISQSAITLTVQGWDADENTTAAMSSSEGVARRELGTSTTVRISAELPNDEDLATTEAYMTDEPMGGTDKTGYREVNSAEDNLIRRSDANADADVDIYTDFPDQPGGLSPDSSQSGGGDADRGTDEGHSANSGLPPGSNKLTTITVSLDNSQWEQVNAILESHGGHLTS